MTLVDLFNGFNEVSRRVTLSSDARSLFLAYLQHWNAQKRPAALDITVQTLRSTASLDEEAYRRAAISLSNLKFWHMKRKAHNKDGRIIFIGNIFFKPETDRRGIDAEPAFSACPPHTPPSGGEEELSAKVLLPSETKTKSSPAQAEEKSPDREARADFSAEWFRDKTFEDVNRNTDALIYLDRCTAPEYESIFRILRKNEAEFFRKKGRGDLANVI